MIVSAKNPMVPLYAPCRKAGASTEPERWRTQESRNARGVVQATISGMPQPHSAP